MQTLFAEPYTHGDVEQTIESMIQSLRKTQFGSRGDAERKEIYLGLLARLEPFDRRRLIALEPLSGCCASQESYTRELVEFYRHYNELDNCSYRHALSHLSFALAHDRRQAESLPFMLEALHLYVGQKDLGQTAWLLEQLQQLPASLRTSEAAQKAVEEVLTVLNGSGSWYHRIIFERCAEMLSEVDKYALSLVALDRIIKPQDDDQDRLTNPNYLYALGFKMYCQMCLTGLKFADNMRPIVAALRNTAKDFNDANRRGGGGGGS